MAGWLIALTGCIYAYVAAELALRGKTGLAVAYAAYAFANTEDQERRDMSDDNTQDAAEPTPASAGSVGEPAAWLIEHGAFFTTDPRRADHWRRAGFTLVPLYRQPQPTLTHAEREAAKRGLPFLDAIGRVLVRRAIARARKAGTRAAG